MGASNSTVMTVGSISANVVWRVRMLPQWLGSGVIKVAGYNQPSYIITEPPV